MSSAILFLKAPKDTHYRIVDDGEVLTINLLQYDPAGVPVMISDTTLPCGATVFELRNRLNDMIAALDLPIVSLEDLA